MPAISSKLVMTSDILTAGRACWNHLVRLPPREGTGFTVGMLGGLNRRKGSPRLPKGPPYGGRTDKRFMRRFCEGGGSVQLVKRLAVAMGSLLALAFAGGAHVRW